MTSCSPNALPRRATFPRFSPASSVTPSPMLGPLLSSFIALSSSKLALLALFRTRLTNCSCRNALGQLKTSQSASPLVALLAPFGDKPLTDLAKRAKKSGSFEVTTEESAFLLLLETLATSLPDYERCVPLLSFNCLPKLTLFLSQRPFGHQGRSCCSPQGGVEVFRQNLAFRH
jgi:hypothetical protein